MVICILCQNPKAVKPRNPETFVPAVSFDLCLKLALQLWPLPMLGLAALDIAILVGYFAIVTYIGVVVGKSRAKSLADFFIAGGQWGPTVSFLFVIASVMGGSAAVVVAGG